MTRIQSLRKWYLERSPIERIRYALLALAGLLSVLLFVAYYTHLGLAYYFSPARTNREGQVVILTASWCPYCRELKARLGEAGFPYREIDVEQDWKTAYAFVATKRGAVPVTVIGNTVADRGLTRQLEAIRALCEKKNSAAAYDCGKLQHAY